MIWPGILSGHVTSCQKLISGSCEKVFQSIQDRLITKKDAAFLFKHQAMKDQATSRQAPSVKLSSCISPDYVLKTDLTERYNYEYKRSFKNSGRFKLSPPRCPDGRMVYQQQNARLERIS